jgi:hypothetical protein
MLLKLRWKRSLLNLIHFTQSSGSVLNQRSTTDFLAARQLREDGSILVLADPSNAYSHFCLGVGQLLGDYNDMIEMNIRSSWGYPRVTLPADYSGGIDRILHGAAIHCNAFGGATGLECLTMAIRFAENLPDRRFRGLFLRGQAYEAKHARAKAIEDFSKALEIRPTDHTVRKARAFAYYDVKDFAKAIEDLKQLRHSEVWDHSLERAWYACQSRLNPGTAQKEQKEEQQSKEEPRAVFDRTDVSSPWNVFAIQEGSAVDVIKSRYRELVKQYHPDKVATLGPELRELAERKTREINRAYEVLVHG